MQCIPQPDPDAMVTAMPEGDLVLLHLRTSLYFSPKATGAPIREMMARSSDPEAMSHALADRFEVTPAAARESVEELLKDPEANQLTGSLRIPSYLQQATIRASRN